MRKYILNVVFFLAGVAGATFLTFLGERISIKNELSRLVTSYPGIRVQAVGKALYLTGSVDQFREIGDLQNIAEGMELANRGYTVTLLPTISEKGKKSLESNFNRMVNSPELGGFFLGDRFLIVGTAENDFEADRAVEIAKTYLAYGIDLTARSPAQSEKARSSETSWQASRSASSAGVLLDMMRIRPKRK